MFTDEEIEAVTEQLLPTGVPRGYTVLGTRKTGVTLDRIQQAAAAVLLLYPNSPYYLASLFSSELLGTVRTVGDQCAKLMSAVDALRRRSVPVSDVSSVSNARVALVELEGVIASSNPPEIANVPSFKRFESNVNRFLRKVASNIRQQNQIVKTPAEAKLDLPGLVEGLQTALTALRAKVEQLSTAQSNYHSVDLARRVSTQVVQNARALLAQREGELLALSETGRLTVLRQTVLELLAAKGVVQKFGSFPAASQGIEVFGSGGPFADATRPAAGGSVTLQPGPYTLTRGSTEDTSRNLLYIGLNGTLVRSSLTATLGVSTVTRASGSFLLDNVMVGSRVYVTSGPSVGAVRRVITVSALELTVTGAPLVAGAASVLVVAPPDLLLPLAPTALPILRGSNVGPFAVTLGVNDVMRFIVNGGAPILVTLPAGAPTPAALAAALNVGLGPTPFVASTAFTPLLFEGVVNVLGNDVSIPYGMFPALFQTGDTVRFKFGANAGQERTITALAPSPSSYHTLTLSGAPLLASQDHIQVGRDLAVNVGPVDPVASIANDDKLLLQPLTSVQQAAGLVLGMVGSQLLRGQPTRVSLLADFISANTPKVAASVELADLSPGHQLRTDVSDTRKIVAVRVRGQANVPAGTSVTIVDTAAMRTSPPVVGDKIVLRSGPSIGLVGTVTASTPTSITATFLTPVTAGIALYEVGANFKSFLERGNVVQVTEGVNNGTYIVNDFTDVPFEVVLQESLPATRQFDSYVLLVGRIASESLKLTNRSVTFPASISVFDPIGVFSPTPVVGPGFGSSLYFRVPELHRNLDEGDLLQLFRDGNTVTPASTHTVSVVGADKVLTLGTSVPESPAAYTFAGASIAPTPSARLQNERTYDFSAFKRRLTAWLGAGPMRDLGLYRSELSRRMNVVLTNANPTQLECGDAEVAVLEVYRVLTEVGASIAGSAVNLTLESILSSYEVGREVEVDTLLRTYKDQGADRAYDLLLSCQFTSFFGADQAELSYGGMLQKAVREIAIEDLPMDKFDRSNAKTGNLITSSPSPDYEFDLSDIEDVGQVDPPE